MHAASWLEGSRRHCCVYSRCTIGPRTSAHYQQLSVERAPKRDLEQRVSEHAAAKEGRQLMPDMQQIVDDWSSRAQVRRARLQQRGGTDTISTVFLAQPRHLSSHP
jgi:hypothetical protein